MSDAAVAADLDICQEGSDGGYVFPAFGDAEQRWPVGLRAVLYFVGTIWCFLGVAIVADLFMGAIEEITSKIIIYTEKATGKQKVRRFWNPTVANLSLMALGSSAPEIMLNVVEVCLGDFYAGDLGAPTIVGSAAFNLLVISAVVVVAITEGTKKVEVMQVYGLTATVSVLSYLWLLVILVWSSPDIITLSEALVTFAFFWILLAVAYVLDRNCFKADTTKVSPMSKTVGNLPVDSKGGEDIAAAPQPGSQLEGMTADQQKALAIQALELLPTTKGGHQRNAMAWLTGKKARPLYKKMKTFSDSVGQAIARATTQALPGGGMERLASKGSMSPRKDMVSVRFQDEAIDVLENAGTATVTIVREGGDADLTVTVQLTSHDISATAGKDYEAVDEEVTFAKGEMTATCSIKIIDDNRWEKTETCRLELSNPSDGAKLADNGTTCVIKILNDDALKKHTSTILQKLGNRDKYEVVMAAWKEQFTEAMRPCPEEEGPASALGWTLHVCVVFWKVLFATVPPASMGGGWPAFFVSLGFIALMTILVGDLAGLFGCVITCPPAITAITFVALGTSMPDTFASKAAAIADDTADNSIGNITGSNCVNVFLGLGLPWTIGAIYWAVAPDSAKAEWKVKYANNPNVHESLRQYIADGGDAVFVVPAGDLGLSVVVFCCCAVTCLLGLAMRRSLYGGELGGPKGPRMGSAGFFVMLWGLYVLISALKTTGQIDFEM